MKWLRIYLQRRELDRNLRNRRIVRQARSAASQKGVSTYWAKAGQQCRQMFGETL